MRTSIPLLDKLVACAILALIAVVCLAATYRDSRDYLIDGFIDSPRLKIRSGANQSSNAVEIIRGDTLELAIPGTNAVAGLKSNLGVTTGATGIIMTSSNISFGRTYSAAPVVVVADGLAANGVYVSAVTTSNFTLAKANTTSNYVRWIAIGAP